MDPLGTSPGKVGDLSSQGLRNDFNNISQNDIQALIDSDRIAPRQVTSGVMRGTQRIVNTDGSYITLGEIPGTNKEFGFGFFDSDGNLVFKMTGTSQSLYNGSSEVYTLDSGGFTFSDDSDRRIRLGKAPNDGRIGDWVSEEGDDVIDLLNT